MQGKRKNPHYIALPPELRLTVSTTPMPRRRSEARRLAPQATSTDVTLEQSVLRALLRSLLRSLLLFHHRRSSKAYLQAKALTPDTRHSCLRHKHAPLSTVLFSSLCYHALKCELHCLVVVKIEQYSLYAASCTLLWWFPAAACLPLELHQLRAAINLDRKKASYAASCSFNYDKP